MSSFLWPSFVESAITGMALWDDSLPVMRRRHRRMLQRAVGKRRGRQGWAMLRGHSPLLAYFDMRLVDNTAPTITVEFDPSGIMRVAP